MTKFNTIFNRTFIIGALVLFSIVAFLSSCVKDYFELDKLAKGSWTPDLAVPLIHSELTLADMLPLHDSTVDVHVDNDNFVTLIYTGRVFKTTDLIDIPDQSFNQSLSIPQSYQDNFNNTVPVGSTLIIPPFTVNGDYNFPGNADFKIDSVFLKQGFLNISVASQIQQDVTMDINISKLRDHSGNFFHATLPMNFAGNLPVTANSVPLDLTGYSLDMTGVSGTSYNHLDITVQATITKTSNNAISPSNTITVNCNLTDLDFSSIFGYLGQNLVTIPADTVDIGLFLHSLGAGELHILDSKLKLTVENSFGVPIGGHIGAFYGFHEVAGQHPITGIPNDSVTVGYPTYSNIGGKDTTVYYLTQASGSNIADVINYTPSYILCDLNAISNPNNDPTIKNFATDSSHFFIDIQVELPMHGTLKGFVLQDTSDFTFDQESDKMSSAMIRINMNNGFPMEGWVQVYMTDTNYNVLDSLIAPLEQIISAAPVGPDEKVDQANAVRKIVDVYFDEAGIFPHHKMQTLKDVKKILVKGTLNTYNVNNTPSQNVKIYSTYKLGVRVGIDAKLKL